MAITGVADTVAPITFDIDGRAALDGVPRNCWFLERLVFLVRLDDLGRGRGRGPVSSEPSPTFPQRPHV
eukprot:3892112-Pyramimonas_sp.AAC.1